MAKAAESWSCGPSKVLMEGGIAIGHYHVWMYYTI